MAVKFSYTTATTVAVVVDGSKKYSKFRNIRVKEIIGILGDYVQIVKRREKKMPPKTVTCEICKEQVMKAQTLAYKEGRACRKHEGVQEYSEQIQAQQKQTLTKSIEKHERKYAPREYVPLEIRMMKCWKCGCEGTSLQNYYLQCAVAMEKMHIVGAQFNFFDMHIKLKEFIPKEFKVPLIIISMGDKKKSILNQFRFKQQQIVEISDLIQVCPTCLKLIGLEKKFQDDAKERIKGLTLETAFIFGSLIKPELEKIAIDQLYDEHIKEKGSQK